MAKAKKQVFEVPTLSSNPGEQIAQLGELIERAKTAMAEAVGRAREEGITWKQLREDSGYRGGTLRRMVATLDETPTKPAKKAKTSSKSSAAKPAAKSASKTARKPAAKKTTKATTKRGSRAA